MAISLVIKNLILFFILIPACFAQPILIEEQLDRTEGLLIKSPVYIRSLGIFPKKQKIDTAILYFNGWPSIARIENEKTFFTAFNNFVKISQRMYLDEKIGLVLMDCPTDQWGNKSKDNPTRCDDNYRSSNQHVEDVKRIIKSLKEKHGIKNFYLMGHSHGTISAKLLGKALSEDVSGVISSSAATKRYPGHLANFGWAGEQFDMNDLKVPVLNVHHDKDGCWASPYSTVLKYSKNNLVTVKGGPNSEPACGVGYHGYEENEMGVSAAIIKWIKNREVTQFVGN